MKISKKILIIILMISFMIIFLPKQNVEASGLVAIQKSSGGNLTYRNSSEVVYRLEEYNYPTNQLRAVWVSPFVGDIPSYSDESQFKSAITAMLDDLVSMGMNAIVYHIRTHNNAMYKSELNPLAKWWADVDFEQFDPLTYVIDECHKRGIEFHAWMNPYRVSSNGDITQYKAEAMPSANPANNSENLIIVNNSIILDPGIPEIRDFLVETCMEVIENYDIDAIHFDDYFYISGADDSTTREKYNTEGLSLADFRRKQVNLFIEDLSKNIRSYNKENNKCVQLGISPSNVYQNGGYVSSPTYDANGNLINPTYSNTGGFAHYGDYLYSDTLNWINNEWIDYIMPQCYHALENTAAPFADVVRWWSWAVRNKKVNFYAGIGIYMTLESGSSYATWKVNENEVELQLLYAGQYEEFGGANFYKYSSLKQTSNAVVADAVDTISNDFWKVRIPSAVNKYYAPLMDEIQPTNVKYDSNTKLLTFDAIDNVRGYMVYKVPKGTLLNKTNINHVYSYTQSTSISITDTTNHDYYVASVNLANEISDATYASIALTSSDIINIIDSLPTNITINDKDQIEQARLLYELLDSSEQVKVTNLDKLVEAENTLTNINEVAKKLDTYISVLDLHINQDRVIPLLENMKIEYKDTSDASLYDITTGTRLKNYLATKIITLILSLTENDITVSREVEFNIGLTPTNMTGLFYRNDPSSISEDDEGLYGPDAADWIGWSNHTLVVDNYILYIAYGNYVEITDSSTINSCNWPSVAGVYVNKTSKSISMKMTDAFEKNSSNKDGYFIISNDKIKSLANGFDTETTITLESDETLVIIRYLDSLLNGSPMAPVTNLSVGTKAYIDNEIPKSNEDLAKELIDLINTIPNDITLIDEILINNINNKYTQSSDEVQALVTNYSVLEEALTKVANLRKELALLRQEAIDEISGYLDLTNYSDKSLITISSYLEDGTASINNATNKEKISIIVENTKALLDSVLTLEEELLAYKNEQIETLETSFEPAQYTIEAQTVLNNYLKDALTSINDATSIDEVDEIVKKTSELIDRVLTLEEERILYIETMEDYIVNYDTTEEIKQELRKYKESYSLQLNEATSNLYYIYTRFKESVNTYHDELAKARTNAIEELNTFVSSLKYFEKEVNYITTLKNEQIKIINDSVSLTTIKDIPSTFIENIDILHEELEDYKVTIVSSLSSLILAHYTQKQIEEVTKLIEDSKIEIVEAGNKQEVDNIYNNLSTTISEYITNLTKAINQAISYFESKNSTTEQNISSLVSDYKKQVSKVGTLTEVENTISAFDISYKSILQTILQGKITTAKTEIETYINNLTYNNVEIEVIKEMKVNVFVDLDLATNDDEINLLKEKFKSDVETYHKTLNEAKNVAKSKVSEKGVKTPQASELIANTISKIDNAKQVEEINTIMNEFNNQFDEVNTKSSSCSCNNIAIIFGYLSISLGILTLILKKKK